MTTASDFQAPAAGIAPISNLGKWLALAAALLGWAFDGMEMGLFPLVAKPALRELLGKDGSVVREANVLQWYGIATASFLIGAATGGILFGWLGDRLGRVRAMTLSVMTYAVITGLCAFATEAWHVVVLRFLAALGMGGEWSLGVALVNEIWPGRSRAFVAGLIGAAANVGFFLSGASSKMLHNSIAEAKSLLEAMGLSEDSIVKLTDNEHWRLLMIVGASPALLCFLIRLFVPESQRWEQERAKGATSHWASRDLLGVLLGAAGACGILCLWVFDVHIVWRIVGTLVGFAVALAGFIYPVLRYLSRAETPDLPAEHRTWPTARRMLIGAALSGVALIVTWGSVQPAPTFAAKKVEDAERAALQLEKNQKPTKEQDDWIKSKTGAARETTQMWSAIGAIVFSILAAFLSDWLGRRVSYVMLCAASLASVLYFYLSGHEYGTEFLAAVFLMGGICSTFYGWLPLYLPELFRTTVRATGQGFCYNFGRILAAVVSLQFGALVKSMASTPDADDGQALACSIFSLVYVIGMLIIWLAPETKGKPLPE